MPRLAKPVNEDALRHANEDFYHRHPDRRSKALTTSAGDAHLREEWFRLYKQYGGRIEPQKVVVAGCRKTSLAACMKPGKRALEVYVYIVEMQGGDPFGHVGLIVQQRDGTYIRYSQAAANPNLHGTDRWQYLPFAKKQEAVVRQKRGTSAITLSAGGHVVRIPTEYPDQVQRAVDAYIADKSYYNVLSNDCAEFVNQVLNAAQDIMLVGAPLPKLYFFELRELYPDCVIK